MITAVPQQQRAFSRDPQGYLKTPMPRAAYSSSNDQSFEDHRSQPAGQAHISTGRDDYVVSRDALYHVPPQRSLHDYSIPPTQNPYVGHEALDQSLEYYHQENLPPLGGHPPRTYYQDDELVAPVRSPVGFYRKNSPQLFVPEATDPSRDYYRSRESRPVPQLGHYYQRENFDRGHQYKQNRNQSRHYYHPSEPYGHDRSRDQCALDLSQYALKPQDHGGPHGYRNPELGPQTRQHAPTSDLKV